MFLAAGLCSLAAFAAPASAQITGEAEQCLIDDSSEQVRKLLMSLATPGQTADPEVKAAFNRTMLTCEQRYGWERAQTINAGSYAGFVLRYRAREQVMIARGVSQARLASLRSAAAMLSTGNTAGMGTWLRDNGYRSLSAFRATSDFAYFDAWMGVVTSARVLEGGTL